MTEAKKPEQKIIYEEHPVTPERKKELRDKGYKILDARFAPDKKEREAEAKAKAKAEAEAAAKAEAEAKAKAK